MTLIRIFVRKLKNLVHLFLAWAAISYYGNPGKNLKIIGITGTDGKTTTSGYIYQFLEMLGKKSVLISTVGVFMDGKKDALGLHVTTPSPITLNKYLKKAKDLGAEFAVLEVSSHAIDQKRIYGLEFEAGTITNVTKEHLDYHRNIENYLNTKIKLLKVSKNVILNLNDPFISKIKSKITNKKVFTYSLTDNNADLSYSSIKNIQTEEMTDYNKRNLLAALLVIKVLDFKIEGLLSGIERLSLPDGRLKYLQKSPFEVIIDFAHTPNAFSALLPEIKKKTKGRIIHVFGSAGKRDRSKRPDMGEISSKYSDVIILTAEDPRGENVHKINSDIRRGINEKFLLSSIFNPGEKRDLSGKIFQIEDRKQAIKFAIDVAKSGDCVVITGKGPEKSMNMGGNEIPWDDIEITKKLLK